PSGTLTFQLKAQGLPVELFGSAGLQEGGFVTASNGTISVVKNTPHPNAVKVYLNYLLSNEGQVVWSKASGLASLRRDVPKDHNRRFFFLRKASVTRRLTERSTC